MSREYDYQLRPREINEHPKEFILRVIKRHQQTHQKWVDWIEEGYAFDKQTIGSKEYQQAAVDRYDQIIRAIGELEAI